MLSSPSLPPRQLLELERTASISCGKRPRSDFWPQIAKIDAAAAAAAEGVRDRGTCAASLPARPPSFPHQAARGAAIMPAMQREEEQEEEEGKMPQPTQHIDEIAASYFSLFDPTPRDDEMRCIRRNR